MNEIIQKEEIKVENMIYEIRGKQVMIDRDLAKLYQVETRTLNQKVKRNIERFPEQFCFKLTKTEWLNLKSQFVISSLTEKDNYGGDRFLPNVFTEQGVAMLSAILKSEVAIKVSIAIIDAFVMMRKYIGNNLIEQKYINKLVLEDHERIDLLQELFNKLEEKTKYNNLFFEGQIYDAYSLLLDILNKSKKEIIIIDNYAGKELLDILKELNKNITIVSKNINEELRKKYNSQYTNIKFINNNSFHDRFIIIDKKILYHCGSSFKDLGKKCFCINLIDDKVILNNIMDNLKNEFNKILLTIKNENDKL